MKEEYDMWEGAEACACDKKYDPYCGVDRRTYGNMCVLDCNEGNSIKLFAVNKKLNIMINVHFLLFGAVFCACKGECPCPVPLPEERMCPVVRKQAPKNNKPATWTTV